MKEIERKILDVHPKTLIARIRRLTPAPQKKFEGLVKVLYFDFPDGRIRKAKDLVRVRVIVPKKGKPWTELVHKKYGGVKNGCKYFDESEFTIPGLGDAQKPELFLRKLGMKRTVFYEKKRTLFTWGSIAFEIDEHPHIPAFLEIEGPSPAAIERAIRLLRIQNHEQTHETISQLLARKYPSIALNGLRFR